MSTQAAPLALRLIMEGIEIPVVSAQVSIAPGAPASAAIQIVPTDTGLLLLPRTFVQLFFLDPQLTQADAALADQLANERSISPFDAEDARYRLLFEGEVIGLQFMKSTNSRSLVLQCLDLSSYWDTCYQWFADFSPNGSGLTDRTHNFVGAGEFLFNNIASGTRWVIGNILLSKPENPRYASATGLLAGYIHLLETIGGIHPKASTFGGFRGVNDFFTVAELRYKLTAMIGAVAEDKTSANVYSGSAFIDWLRNGMSSAGSLVSFRDVLRLVGQYIFHETYPNPAARFIAGGTPTTIRTPKSIEESALGSELVSSLQQIKASLESASSAFKTVAATANAISWANGRTPIGRGLQDLQRLLGNTQGLTSSERAFFATRVAQAAASLSEALDRLNAISSIRPVQEDDVSTTQGGDIANRIDRATLEIGAALSSSTRRRQEFVEKTVTQASHLFSQLILPETFFLAPPRCNVFFPDSYTQFTFSRNFMREVTRLSVMGGLGIIAGSSRNAGVLGRYYFAPNIRDVRGKMARATIFRQGTTILPHEIHSGIVPKFEWVSDGHRWASKVARGENSEERKIRYIQRLANFQFLIHRWSARVMSLSGRFNPYPVIGFPGVVIDRSSPSASALEAISDELGTGWSALPTAYVGKVEQLTHIVSQGGGNTTVVFGKARTHRSYDDEFLGILNRENKDLQDVDMQVSVSVLVDNLRAGVQPDEIERKIVTLYIAGTLRPNLKLSTELIVKTRPTTSSTTSPLSIESARLLGISDEAFQAFAGPPDPSGAATTIAVPSTIFVILSKRTALGRFVSPRGGIRPEVILRPGWYSTVWSSENISDKVYQPLLGCPAMTEDIGAASSEAYLALLRLYLAEDGGSTSSLVVEEGPENVGVIKLNGKEIATFDIGNRPSVEQAIDALTLSYGTIRRRNLDVSRFINDYNFRPIATMVEIVGSANLEFNDAGEVAPSPTGPAPIEGFHSRSFGDYNTNVRFSEVQGLGENEGSEPEAGDGALHLLLTESERKQMLYPIYDKGKRLKDAAGKDLLIPLYLDPRGRAHQRVRAYVAELKLNRGLAGL